MIYIEVPKGTEKYGNKKPQKLYFSFDFPAFKSLEFRSWGFFFFF